MPDVIATHVPILCEEEERIFSVFNAKFRRRWEILQLVNGFETLEGKMRENSPPLLYILRTSNGDMWVLEKNALVFSF